MHPRSCFATTPDFQLLALTYPDLAPHVRNGQLDFGDPAALRAVTACFFKHFFSLSVTLSNDRLCPALGNRLNYVLWLEDLINDTHDDTTQVRGVDIGTGSTAVYALLAASKNKTWHMLATESDPASYAGAVKNVEQNDLSDRIQVLKADPDAPILLQHEAIKAQPVTFIMCNPPFYSDADDIAASAELKADASQTSCTGAPCEMITAGGEVAFVMRIFGESQQLGIRVQWYTSMLGKLSSVESIVQKIRELGICNYVLHVLVQGKTRRWVVGWSFGSRRAMPETAASDSLALKALLPQKIQYSLSCKKPWIVLQSFCENHSIDWHWQEPCCSMIIHVERDTWSRRARRGNTPKSEVNKMTILARLTASDVQLVLRSAHDNLLFRSLCNKLVQSLKQGDAKIQDAPDKPAAHEPALQSSKAE